LNLRSLITLIAIVLGGVMLYRSNWARAVSDIPVHAVLSLTSEFEREGRDPAKSAT
jgi:hypothetical protein